MFSPGAIYRKPEVKRHFSGGATPFTFSGATFGWKRNRLGQASGTWFGSAASGCKFESQRSTTFSAIFG